MNRSPLRRKTPLRCRRIPEKKPRPRGRRRFTCAVRKAPRVNPCGGKFEGEFEDSQGRPWLRVMRDGRQVLNPKTRRGWLEYHARIERMLVRQGGVCCLYGIAPDCPGALKITEATFEHETPKGMGGGSRDDRIEANGKRINGAAHYGCNQWKGSRRISYNNAQQHGE